MKKAIAGLVFLISVITIVGFSFSETTISWDKAHLYYGKEVTVKGKVVATHNSGKACFLNFHTDYKKHFSAVIFAEDFDGFPVNPEDYYYGREVSVKGTVKEYNGKPEIVLTKLSQIAVVGEKEKPEKKNDKKTEKKSGVISWEDADKYNGRNVTVEGTIVASSNSGKVCFLNFHNNYKRYLTLVIFASDFAKFPDSPENYYLDKKVRVSGLVKEYNGKPEIVVKSPNQIKILK